MNDNTMNDNTKIEVAREIMNAMLGRYGQGGYDKSNTNLIKLLELEKAMSSMDMDLIDEVIKEYQKNENKLFELNINTQNGMKCKSCQNCNNKNNSDLTR